MNEMPKFSMNPITEKSWGYEKVIYNDKYCMKLLVYTKPGIASSLHYHERKHETFFIASGRFYIEINGLVWLYEPGEHAVLSPGMQHRVRCLEPGTIVEASTHDDPNDCVRLIPSE